MMEIFSTYPLYALIVSNAALLCGATIALLRFERRVKESSSFWDSPTGASVAAAGNSEAALSGFLERRLAMLQQQIEELGLQKAPAPPAELPFAYATRMAKHGASVEDLTRTCGLKKAEAQLMRRLYSRQSRAPDSLPH